MPEIVKNASANPVQEKFQQALALHQRGRLSQAQALYEDILNSQPDQYHVLNLMGVIALQSKNFHKAVDFFDRAIRLKPDFAEAYSNRGIALKELGHPRAAIAGFEKAIACKPDYADAYVNRANVLKDLKELEAAVAGYDKAITLKPGYAEAYYNRGKALCDLRQLDAALASYNKAINLRPGFAEAYSNRGNVLRELNQPDAALASFDKAISLKPDSADTYANRGHVLRDLMRLDSALASYDRAIGLKPDNAETFSNRGNVLKDLNRLDAALASYDKAIALKPDYADAFFNKSLVLLLSGDLELGWELYEWRWKTEHFAPYIRSFRQPQWSGMESLEGRSLLLHSEQGLGDAIQFSRYAEQAANLGARVILEVCKPLAGLFSDLAGVTELVFKGEPLPTFDFHCPLMSLPLAFKTRLESIPCPPRYLRADTIKLSQWTNRLGEKTRPRVGLVWSGSATNTNDHNRSIPVSTLMQQMPVNFQYVSLQKDIRDSDKRWLESQTRLLNFDQDLNDFSDTAALCELMDVIISIDTSVAHLSGALGRPTWILLPFSPDWRWLMDRDDSPWYRSVKLFRQDNIGDWESVLARVAASLSKLHDPATGDAQ